MLIGAGTNPLITVDFTAGGDNTLQLDTSWDFTHPVALSGGTGTDTLVSSASGSHTWTITGAGAGNIASTLNFTGIDILQADPANNTDTIQGQDVGSGESATWTFDSDTLSSSYDHVSGSTSDPTMPFSGFATVQAGNATGSGISSFVITGNGLAGPVNLLGGSGSDSFSFSGTAQLDGTIDGGTGNNSLSYYSGQTNGVTIALGSADSSGYSGTDGSITNGFSGISTLIGSGSSDLLTGLDVDSTWNLNSTPTYTDNVGDVLSFSSFQTLQGGSAVDTFNVSASITASLNGGAGDDVFDFQANGITLAGKIDGGSGTNTLMYSGYTSPVRVSLASGLATATSGFSNLEALQGHVASDSTTTLVGPNSTNTWTVTNTDAGTVAYGSNSFSFANVGNITGGVGNDSFLLSDANKITGTLDGGIGTNLVDLSDYGANTTVDITGNNSGNVQEVGVTGATVNFKGIGSFVGSTLNDTFVFSNRATVSGTIDGNGGEDTLDYSLYTTSVRVDLTLRSATGIGGGLARGITGISDVTGGTANDILLGSPGANVLDGGPGGNDILVGRAGDDTLTVHGSGRNIVIGGDGNDTINAGATTGDNLLISGKYDNEANVAALNSLMAEWGRTDANYNTRIGHLLGQIPGGRNGSYTLVLSGTNQNVHNNGSTPETVIGGTAGLDWFIVAVDDVLINYNSSAERRDNVTRT
jgi:hypothetical protein